MPWTLPDCTRASYPTRSVTSRLTLPPRRRFPRSESAGTACLTRHAPLARPTASCFRRERSTATQTRERVGSRSGLFTFPPWRGHLERHADSLGAARGEVHARDFSAELGVHEHDRLNTGLDVHARKRSHAERAAIDDD